jgi:hypothetical protein
MPRPITLRDRMKTAIQVGVPDLQRSSVRPATAEPNDLRLQLAEEWLRAGACIGDVVYHTGLSRHLVRVIANCIHATAPDKPEGWHFVVPSEDWELAESREREAAKWQARQARKKVEEIQ